MMFKRLTTETLNWIIIIGVILFVIEISFFHGGLIFSALFSALLIYIGWKKFTKLWGKIVFWIGIISILFSILNMMAVRFFIIAGIVLFIVHYMKSKKEADRIKPIVEAQMSEEPLTEIQVTPLFDSRLFDDQATVDRAYAWRDVNIHGIFGDRIIDLSNTVLPDDTVVISIRHVIGNIKIYVPYEVEVCIHHSSIFGRATILGKYHEKLMNETLSYQTENYRDAGQRIKIITSVLSGDIEVKRI